MDAGPAPSTFWVLINRHHGIINNPYFHPCDEHEKGRLDGLQYLFRSTYGRNVMVHLIKKPTLIIDVGTGSGYLPPPL